MPSTSRYEASSRSAPSLAPSGRSRAQTSAAGIGERSRTTAVAAASISPYTLNRSSRSGMYPPQSHPPATDLEDTTASRDRYHLPLRPPTASPSGSASHAVASG